MKKHEFLKELRNALEGRLPSSEIKEILSDYEDIFEASLKEGKEEEIISEDIGSPAKIARNILEDSFVGDNNKSKKIGRKLESKVSSGVDNIYDKITGVDEQIDTSNLATMGKRIGAYFTDGVVICLIPYILTFLFVNFIQQDSAFNIIMTIMPLMILLSILGLFNAVNTLILWATNGYTLGKWFLHIKVVKIDGTKIKFLDAFIREFLVKSLGNAFTSGILNLLSFVWGCATTDHKTVQDFLAKTKVVNTKSKGI